MRTTERSSSSSRVSRLKLRQATFILPKTGQRLNGFVSLSSRDLADDSNDEERIPLLSEVPGEVVYQPGALSRIYDQMLAKWKQMIDFAKSELGKGVLKCSLAYVLGSLATFIPAISAFLGHQDGKHVVATITVYFHPARSRGSMYKALICALLAFLYAAIVSITSMCVAMFFEDTLDLLPVGHAVVLIIFCGGGFGFIGWTKQRLNDPLVNVACSLASLSTITVLTKEGAVQKGDLSFAKISQTLKMLFMGVCATMAISFLMFPISARKELRSNMTTVTNTLAFMLGHVTDSFLTGSEDGLQSTNFVDASTRNRKAYDRLDKLVKEAKLEHFVAGTEREYRLEKRLVRCVQDIAQNMGGLRSAAALQFQLLKPPQSNAMTTPHGHESIARKRSSDPSLGAWSIYREPVTFTSIVERPEDELVENQTASVSEWNEDRESHSVHSPQAMFEVFIDHLGPSMRSFAFTLKEIFSEIPFGPHPEYKVSFNSRYQTSLDRALELYRSAREEALMSIYRQKDFAKLESPDIEADLEEVSASCGHFSFSLMEFGEQLKDLLEILDELQLEAEERPRGRSWNWLKFWRHLRIRRNCTVSPDTERLDADLAPSGTVARHLVQKIYLIPGTATSEQSRMKHRVAYRIWKSFSFFRRDDTKFALKVGAGAALYALPSFLASTRPIYSQWRGEWGLLSYMLVCSMTIGASNTTGYARFLGTCLGACCAILSWYISAGNIFGLIFLGWLMATWTAYIILVKGQGPMGRFIMLTYNLSVLYAYSLSRNDNDNDDDEGGAHPVITEIALHRVVSVLSGCIWGIIVTRIIWPISARKKLKDGLSLLWLQMSLIWKRDPLSTMVNGQSTIGYLNSREKLLIERFLSRLEGLQAAARSEFELRTPFPDAAYRNILSRTRSMLNALYAMNLEILKNLSASEGEISLLQYTAQERLQLSARISHLLSVLASSMKLEYSLNDALPSIEHARDRLLTCIFHYRQDKSQSSLTTDSDYALLYAYVLVTGQLGDEIVQIIGEISRLFGVLSEDVIELQ